MHISPLFSSPSRPASAHTGVLWYSCQRTSRNKLSLPLALPLCLLCFEMCPLLLARQPPQLSTSSFLLLAALRPFFTNTGSVQIDHILIWNPLCSVSCPNLNKCQGKEQFHVIIRENYLPVKSCYFHKDRDCLDPGSEVRFRSRGEWCVTITLRIFAALLIQRSELCLQYITTAGFVILCKLLPKFHNN